MTRRPSALLLAGGAVICFLVLAALLADVISPYDPYAIDTARALMPPSVHHWAGTDALGRDVLSRIIHGGRASLAVACGIVAIGLAGGFLIGAASALAGGIVDLLVMRAVEIVMALPGLVIALALTAALGPSLVNLTLAMGLLGIPFYARVVRGEVLSLRQRPYVKASMALGGRFWRIVITHIIPNVAPTLVTLASLSLSGAVLAASALSFVGLGAQPPLAEWGALIFDGRDSLLTEWWIAVFPGIAVFLAALGFNLLGDGLRDWLDPKQAA
jgi:peptide/nickel transport system permease protein